MFAILQAQTPQVYFPFDGASLNSTVGTGSLNPSDNTLPGFTSNTQSGSGDALHLSGNQYFFSDFASDTGSVGFTVSYWMKREYYGGIGVLVGQLQKIQADYVGTFNTAVFQDGNVRFEFYQGPATSWGVTTTDTLPLDWHFMTFKWKSTGANGMIYIYQNGIVTDSTNAPGHMFVGGTSQPLFIGALKTTTFGGPGGPVFSFSSPYQGNIDEVKYFNAALTDAQILHLYNPTMGFEENYANDIALNMYPNPTRNILQIQSNQPIMFAEVFDAMGKKVLKINGNVSQLDVNTLGNGVYTLRVRTSNGFAAKKFIKE